MIVFGITGSICCGKSNITKVFLKNDIPIIDADIIARDLTSPGKKALEEIHDCFNQDFERASFAKFIFSNKDARLKLNNIMFPKIKEEVNKKIKEFEKQGQYVIGYDCALIIEMGDANKYYPLIVASCSYEEQIERLLRRSIKNNNPLSREEAILRINAQLSSKEKIKYADYVIDTNNSKEETTKQVELIIKHLRSLRRT